ncbi:MAG TPA: GntR family transcriptional regulator [Solirubrobacterales bacterium]|nr:GntR family transcriptional regulator [Solirubrobacterales bacterium]
MVKPIQTVQGRPEPSPVSLSDIRELDRESEVPLYFQLATALKVLLEVGGWEAGARFFSEREIEEQFKVSRAVIRPALELLVSDGAIYRVKGSGAFVAPVRCEVQVTGLVRLALERHDDLAITVHSARKRLPDRTVSHFLEIEDQQTPVTHVTAVVDLGKPSVFLVDSFSTADVPWMLPTARALRSGEKPPAPNWFDLTRATVSIEHTFFGEWASSRLGASAGDPALMGRFVQFGRANESGREHPVEFARLVYRADIAQLAFELS